MRHHKKSHNFLRVGSQSLSTISNVNCSTVNSCKQCDNCLPIRNDNQDPIQIFQLDGNKAKCYDGCPAQNFTSNTNDYEYSIMAPITDEMYCCDCESQAQLDVNGNYHENNEVVNRICQLDGNTSLNSSSISDGSSVNGTHESSKCKRKKGYFNKFAQIANYLPVVAVCNLRSFFPKLFNFKNDFVERNIDVGLLCEVWQKFEDKKHSHEIEKLLELDGLKYFSTVRPKGKRGGGAAIIVNLKKFSVEKIDVNNPYSLEICWALAKPRSKHAKVKKIILCSFYCAPKSRKKAELIDHIICTLQSLTSKYPNCCICLGGDKNKLDISQLLCSSLKLVQMVNKGTRKGEILDIFVSNYSQCYNQPEIIPPVPPDNPSNGVPSDHHVPLCTPHTDPLCPPKREYKVITYRPLPDSKLHQFGNWITQENWDSLDETNSPENKVETYNKMLLETLDKYCPTKTVSLRINDEPFTTADMKTLKRRRQREYCSKGKTNKYYKLKKEFKAKYERAAKDFLLKQTEALRISNPAQLINTLKKMGAPPGQLDDVSSFTLENHENLSPLQAAEKIAYHFSKISQEFPPLNYSHLPRRVLKKLETPESESCTPKLSPFEVHEVIKRANKPKSGVPSDLPRKIVSEFAPELSTPMCKIYNSILETAKYGTAKWPPQWKIEWGTPLQKTQNPKNEDELRVISLTPFPSKVMEKFVMTWLLMYVGDQIDPRQYGGLKNNSISHYLIEIINFILYNQDFSDPIAILACAIDFSKAFNRVNHNILITKLSDMGVPGWLLNLVMGFLTNREMRVRYKGCVTQPQPLPGGGPQGSLLGGFLFLILINLCGFPVDEISISEKICSNRGKFSPETLHAKFVDDMTLIESINLKENLIGNPDRPLPDPFRTRTGHVLPPEKSQVYNEIANIQNYAHVNQMKLNYDKTKFILFNPCRDFDFLPELTQLDQTISCVESIKLLGIHLRSDLSWVDNSAAIVKKAYSRLWPMKRLKSMGAEVLDLKEVYIKQVRPMVEFGVPVWTSSLTQIEVQNIERVQKAALHVILGDQFKNYHSALQMLELQTLEDRRLKLCETFAKNAVKNPKFSNWFQIGGPKTRSDKIRYCVPQANRDRFARSPIPFLTNLLNAAA